MAVYWPYPYWYPAWQGGGHFEFPFCNDSLTAAQLEFNANDKANDDLKGV